MGGFGKEAKISLQSGNTVFNNMDLTKYKPYKIFLFKNDLFVIDNKNIKYIINKNDFSFKKKNQIIKFDIIFNIIHGSPGENGILQAYFDLIRQKYTGCGFNTSVLTFNKKYCIEILKPLGIKSAKSFLLKKHDYIDINKISENITFPCIIKPNKSGSSLGISKVENKNFLKNAIKIAFDEDNEIIIEKFLNGIEISVTILKYQGKIKILPITEIISYNNFFDYEAKYCGKSKEITPARLSNDVLQQIYYISKKIYIYLNIKGLSRIEYIIINNIPYFLEINTIPGLTTKSILPQQAAKANISLKNIITDIIDDRLN